MREHRLTLSRLRQAWRKVDDALELEHTSSMALSDAACEAKLSSCNV